MHKKIFKIVSFLLILIILLHHFEMGFNYKNGDGIYSLTTFYDVPDNTIDVMFFGSSHIFENVNTGILWDDFGIAAFDLCGSVQPFWNTYYYIKEALKKQSPGLIVMDVYGAIQKEDYIDESRIIKNNFGLQFSKDKIDSIEISSPKETNLSYILEYPLYHSRYNELTMTDFTKYKGENRYRYWKGFGINTVTTSSQEPINIETSEVGELTEKCENYLRKIIEFVTAEKIPLLLIKTPYYTNIEAEKIYNRVAQIAKEYDVPFIDYNLMYDEIGIDFTTDYADTSHLNYKGNIKFTKYLGNYLKQNYEIPDRKDDESYFSYKEMALDCRQRVANQEAIEIKDIGNYIDKIQNENYLIVYSISGDYKNMENYDAVKRKLSTVNIDLDTVDGDSLWIMSHGELINSSYDEQSYLWHTELNQYNDLLIKKENSELSFIYNKKEYKNLLEGLNIFVYDKITENVIECVRFPLQNSKLIYQKLVNSYKKN